ncbi:MAG: histidine kinase [Saprospiraceae bacterium]|nr:histidine kinase [Saprospiraceae bacterium]
MGYTQPSSFYHLSTAEGLSDNKVNIAARDKNGILWIGTSEGLNSFDGNRITAYYKNQYPEIQSDVIENILIDPQNRIWIHTNSHYLTMLDENRKFHKFLIGDTNDSRFVRTILYSPKHGVFALKSGKHYFQQKNGLFQITNSSLPFDTLISQNTVFIYGLHGDKFASYKNSILTVVDYNKMSLVWKMNLPGLCGVSHINEDEIIAFTTNGSVFYRISIKNQSILKEYTDIKDQENEPIASNLRNISRIDSSRFLITTPFSGLYLYDISKNSAYRWKHDPMDARSLGGNNTYRAKYDSSGYVFVTTLTSGLHFLNLKHHQIKSKPYFANANKEIFDGFIQSLTTDRNGVLWMGAQDRLIKWDPVTNTTTYIPCILPDGTNLSGRETFRVVTFDKSGNFWVGTTRNGILIFSNKGKLIKHFSVKGNEPIPSNWINAICEDHDGNHWIGTRRGLCMVDKNNLTINLLKDHHLLSDLSQKMVNTIWTDTKGKLWIGTGEGVFCYDKYIGTLNIYTTKQGLIDNNVLAINKDLFENTYIGTTVGLSILGKDGKFKNFTRENGLQNNRCEGILRDLNGFMWIGNLNCILRYDPINDKIFIFEDGHGFNHGGFRMRSSHKTKTGEMFWGTDKGLNWFTPEKITAISQQIRPEVNSLKYGDSIYLFTKNVKLSFPFNASGFIFNFSSGELTGISKTQFLYKLEGLDEKWQKPVSSGQAIYNKLPSGKYSFILKASRDGSVWYQAPYAIDIEVAYPWWEQDWFTLLVIAFFFSMLYLIYRSYQKKKEAIVFRETIQYFTNSGYEHSSVDDILWDICRNVIARLGFEDCVIYVPDQERKVYIQKAALGKKSTSNNKIFQPIEIPFGKGIVGQAGQTSKSVIIADTTKSAIYIKDDATRLSELTVPIIHDGQVIGIIDSENPKKNFYTLKHLEIIETIASLCANKISRSMALELMKKSEKELMALKVKMAESRFLNLRLQMNPHFIFNSLSAIQHLIVTGQTTKAYKYLSTFSNFLRSLLKFAECNFISIDDEIRMLGMYLELESLRFDQTFNFNIIVDESLTNEELLVPSLLVQPFVENAIWHGLLHKEGDKSLKIEFQNVDDEYINCMIEDNGVGRLKSAEIQKNKISVSKDESRGIHIVKERLFMLQQKAGKPASVQIVDLINEAGDASGTKIIVTIPFYNQNES